MNITINKGSNDVIIDSEDLIHLFQVKIKVLAMEKPKDYKDSIIQFQDGIIRLSEQLLALPKH